jgi:hypothetical protein
VLAYLLRMTGDYHLSHDEESIDNLTHVMANSLAAGMKAADMEAMMAQLQVQTRQKTQMRSKAQSDQLTIVVPLKQTTGCLGGREPPCLWPGGNPQNRPVTLPHGSQIQRNLTPRNVAIGDEAFQRDQESLGDQPKVGCLGIALNKTDPCQ